MNRQAGVSELLLNIRRSRGRLSVQTRFWAREFLLTGGSGDQLVSVCTSVLPVLSSLREIGLLLQRYCR
jgi:hypothetical protein